MIHANEAALAVYLEGVQRRRETFAAFFLPGQRSEGQLHQLLDELLPMVQTHRRRLTRERNGFRVTMTLGYREGVLAADAWLRGEREHPLLRRAEALLAEMSSVSSEETARQIVALVTRTVGYRNLPCGRPGYGQVVTASAALVQGQANCQGISDAVYLLGTMAGLQMSMLAGRNPRGPHLWNTVRIGEHTFHLDATRVIAAGAEAGLMTDRQARENAGLSWRT